MPKANTAAESDAGKKPVQIGLSVGESFAELSVQAETETDSKLTRSQRWFLAKKNLGDGIKDAFKEFEISGAVELHVASHVVERSLARGQGGSPALIVASGFETFFKSRQPILSPTFTLEPKRKTSPVNADTIFGISGRTRADGSIEAPLRIEELEFLKSKLELLKIKYVAIALPHADKNPEQEEQAANYFREQGLKVFVSHSLAISRDPITRWTEIAELAYAELAVEEEHAQIVAALDEVAPGEWQIHEWTREGHGLRGGLISALTAASATASVKEPTLHLGLDEFYLVQGETLRDLQLSSSQGLKMGEWTFPGLSGESVGFEPGPMLFGKSHQLSILDILFVQDRLQPIEGLTPLISEKSRGRIGETLQAWGKSAGLTDGMSRLDTHTFATDIESGFIERLAFEAFSGLKGRVYLQGALASSLLPLLRKRRPDLDLVLKTTAEWAESLSCLEDAQ